VAGDVTDDLVLEMRGIRKEFPGVIANDNVSFDVRRGEVHALLGENGAGKSTLMNILYGLYRPDAGEIRLNGKSTVFASARDAIQAGIGMVHQHFMLIPVMTVAENIVLGTEPVREGIFLDEAAADRRVSEMAKTFRFEVDPDARVEDISVGQQQRVEIMKALYRNADVLILDEPTAVLTPQERDGLFAVIRNLTADGRTVLFVTHKLHEAMAISDRVTVLRDGRVAARMTTAETSPREIIRAMTGRAVNLTVMKGPSRPGAVVLNVEGLTVGEGLKPVVDSVSLAVRAGEVVGVAGVAGNGQTELIEALTGLRIPDKGRVEIAGRDVTSLGVAEHRQAGLAYIPEDRALTGAALKASAADNLAMGFQRRAPLAHGALIDHLAVAARAKRLIERFGIKIRSERQPVGSLSGGNLQKVVVARELEHEAPLLIAEQPTRGLDIGAIEFIHALLIAERDRGKATLLVSAELAEIMGLSDRILVMFEGRILADIPAGEADEETLGLIMAGRMKEAA
jgi:general nucleoside transport system ATP-binding protein